MDEQALYEIQRRAERAKDVLEQEFMQEFLAEMRDDAWSDIRLSDPGEQAKRETAYWMLWAADRFEEHLKRHIAEGAYAAQREKDNRKD